MPFSLGQVFKGKIMKAQDFGFFVLIEDAVTRYRKEGLVHVSQIRQGVRLEKAIDSGYDINDEVYVKLTQIREDGKLSLSMKECDQYAGVDLNPERTQQILADAQSQKDGKGQVEDQFVITGAIDFKGEHVKVNVSRPVARQNNEKSGI